MSCHTAVPYALARASLRAERGSASDDAHMAFENLWALQFRAGDLNGAWAWLNFHLEPWESGDAAYFGACLAAIAVGTEPGGYAASTDIQDRLKKLREFLQRGVVTTPLFNRVMLVWASARLPGVLSAPERQAIVDALWSAQNADGGWSLMSLGQFKRSDGTVLDASSDGYVAER